LVREEEGDDFGRVGLEEGFDGVEVVGDKAAIEQFAAGVAEVKLSIASLVPLRLQHPHAKFQLRGDIHLLVTRKRKGIR